jgi:hypothetical protein
VTTGNNARTGDGRVPVIGPGVRHPVPIALSAAAWRGGQVVGDDDRIYFSNGTEWRDLPFADEARSLTEAPALVTVGPGGEFGSLNAAFAYLARFAPPRDDFTQATYTELRLLTGYAPTQPLFVVGFDFSWVEITAVDATVLVPTSACGNPNNVVPDIARYFMVFEGAAPRFRGANFRLDHTWAGSDTLIAGLRYFGARINGQCTLFQSGFSNFSVNVRCSANAVVDIIWSELLDGRTHSIEVIYGGLCSARGVIARAAVGNSLFCRHGGNFSTRFGPTDVADSGIGASDFRKTAGVDSSSDVLVTRGGIIQLEENTLCGTSQPVNVPTGEGLILRSGSVGPSVWPGILKPESYTVATVPSAAAFPAHAIHVSNGDSGAPCLAVSDGTDWLRIALGAAVST